MSEIVESSLNLIDPNPYRNLEKYPVPEHTVEALMRSIQGVGMWEGIIARRAGKRFQLAFGHKRVEAARRLKLASVPLIVRPLTDEQMVQFMGRENLEDYNADFMIMLESWQAAQLFRGNTREKTEAIDIARLLGWVDIHADGYDRLNHTARACEGADKLIAGHHMHQSDFAGLSVGAARQLAERTISRIEMVDKLATKTHRPAAEISAHKKHIAGAARSVARDYREGTIAKTNIRQEIDFRAVRSATAKQKDSPIFAKFAKELADSIHKMLVSDLASDKLEEMERALRLVSMEEDKLALKRVDFALGSLEQTAGKWRQRLTEPRGEKVVPFKLLKSEESK